MKHERIPLLIINARIHTPVGTGAVHGEAMRSLRVIEDGAVLTAPDGTIAFVGDMRHLPSCDPAGVRIIDARGRVVIPGFVDSHTHAVFGGYRPEEFRWRLDGDTYMSIMERGGGIASTVKATRTLDAAAMARKALPFLQRMARMGVTTVEIKSGYGLDRHTEMEQLQAIDLLRRKLPVDVVPTWLAAHAMPPGTELSNDGYIDLLINEYLPEVAASGLADFCDIFCEKGVFTTGQSRRLLQAAALAGLRPKIHADEIVNTGGAELGAEVNALSADHLLHISQSGIDALAASDTVATLLPLTAFALREQYAPARKLIDGGAAVALASDFNPGSCFSFSIPLMFALACIHMRMSVEEAITALTLNGAAALGRAADRGSLEYGKRADIVMLAFPSVDFLPYHTGVDCVEMVVAGGEVIREPINDIAGF